jgi:soluble lytic murein transglycosylase-like protein
MRRRVIATIAGLAVTGTFVAAGINDLGGPRTGSAFGAWPAAPIRKAVVPAEYRKWIDRSAKQCKHLTRQLIASQIHQESAFDPKAVSVTGARGIAQFMPKTWKAWGRDADGNGKTSPHEPGDAIMAQGRLMCSLAKQAKEKKWRPGTVELALAGYNAGWGAVLKYRGIPPYPETERYVANIMHLAKTGVPSLEPDKPSKDGDQPSKEAEKS